MKELDLIRQDVLLLTQEIIEKIQVRKNSVAKIQELKPEQKTFKNFSPQREVFVFEQLKALEMLTLKEILSLSLLIESHAEQKGDYPKWSEGCHLRLKPQDISHQINPILLASTFKSRYDALPLNLEFEELLNKYLS